MRWIIMGKVPKTGFEFAFSGHKGCLALVPVQDGVVRGAFAWETAEEAEAYLQKQLEAAPDLERLGPFEIVPMELPS